MFYKIVICKLYETRTDLGRTSHQVTNDVEMDVHTLINIEMQKHPLFALRHEADRFF